MPTLRDYSVKFGRDPVQGLEGKNCFPFFYSLVNHNDIDWTVGATPPDMSTYTIFCKRASVTPHYVRLDPDYNYKLIAIKYSAYASNPPVFDNSSALPLNPTLNLKYVAKVTANGWTAYNIYKWNGLVWVVDNSVPAIYQTYERFNTSSLFIPDLPSTPYTGYVQVSLSVQGSGSQTLFGGQNVQAITGGNARIPLAVECMQGYEYGFQALRCEYLIPLQGVLSFEFTNTSPDTDLYIAAMMYGVKIRL